ncbi:hypothetical protein JCM9279_003348 [Rhodotorula babjevae]
MAPSYQSLPAELLSRVAELVHEQDLAFAAALVPQAVPAKGDNPGVEVNVPAGIWSWWHGRGIFAMVQVDHRTRASAVPFLYESITAKQTSARHFRLSVLGERLGDSIGRLDITRYLEPHAVSLACALGKLPNLSSITVGPALLHALGVGGEPSEDLAALFSAVRHALGKVTSLEAFTVSAPALRAALGSVSGDRLRKLCLIDSAWPAGPDKELEVALRALVNLVQLEFGQLGLDELVAMRRSVRLTSVRTVVLRTRRSYHENLHLAHDVAPFLVRLIVHVPASPNPLGSDALPSPLLPTLESLIVETDSYVPAFHQLDLLALKHYKVTLDKDCDEFPLDVDEVPFRAAPLRTITLAFGAHPYLAASEKLVRTCSDAGVQRIVEHTPVSMRELQVNVVMDVAAPVLMSVVDEGKLYTVLKTLAWARRRANWLYDVDDGPGLHELAHATVRLHERYLMERL